MLNLNISKIVLSAEGKRAHYVQFSAIDGEGSTVPFQKLIYKQGLRFIEAQCEGEKVDPLVFLEHLLGSKVEPAVYVKFLGKAGF